MSPFHFSSVAKVSIPIHLFLAFLSAWGLVHAITNDRTSFNDLVPFIATLTIFPVLIAAAIYFWVSEIREERERREKTFGN